MKQVVIHIGSYKTGTSSIQRTLTQAVQQDEAARKAHEAHKSHAAHQTRKAQDAYEIALLRYRKKSRFHKKLFRKLKRMLLNSPDSNDTKPTPPPLITPDNDQAKPRLLADTFYLEAHTAINEFPRGFSVALYVPEKRIPRLMRSKVAKSDEPFEDMRLRFRQQYFSAFEDYNKFILSNEYFFDLQGPEIRQLRKDLSANADTQFKIILYVRDPISYYLSRVQQHIKHSHKVRCPYKSDYKFRETICLWEKVFPGDVVVKAFDRKMLTGGCVVQDFLGLSQEFLNTQFETLDILLENESISVEAMYILQRFRAELYADMPGVALASTNKLLKSLMKNHYDFEHKPKLKPWVSDFLSARHADDLLWLKEAYNIDFINHDSKSNSDNPPLARKKHWEIDDQLEGISETHIEKRLMLLFDDLLK